MCIRDSCGSGSNDIRCAEMDGCVHPSWRNCCLLYTSTTTAAVSDGIPPIALVTSMAIGVVTDFGASERITSVSYTHLDVYKRQVFAYFV